MQAYADDVAFLIPRPTRAPWNLMLTLSCSLSLFCFLTSAMPIGTIIDILLASKFIVWKLRNESNIPSLFHNVFDDFIQIGALPIIDQIIPLNRFRGPTVELHVYTDGSDHDNLVGFAFCVYCRGSLFHHEEYSLKFVIRCGGPCSVIILLESSRILIPVCKFLLLLEINKN